MRRRHAAGATNLATYNNCGNGGDYGDFATTSVLQPQDAYSSGTNSTSLTLASPEVVLLDAIGFNILSSPVVAVGTATPGTATPQSFSRVVGGGIDDGLLVDVPEPASIALFGFGLTALGVFRRRGGRNGHDSLAG